MTVAVPWDFGEARENAARAAKLQRAAEAAYRGASRDLAEKERSYRVALAKEITRLHASGVAWTTSEELGRGNEQVADLRYARDLAKGVLKASAAATWRQSANRKDCDQFIEWSRNVAPTGQYEQSTTMRRAA